ncbi:lysozyme inhibitor LprI family protein [Dyella sp. KULCS107]|uniref:lysozyme inhibitor LprI family protein n=1 Tax=Dyella sp. KULCS107 TaxID=3422216 RepID=UPI003D6EB57F
MAEGHEDKEIHMRLRSTLRLASALALMGTTATAAILPNSLPQPPDRPETTHGVAISSNAERLSLISLRYYGVRPAYDACMEQSQGTAPAQQDCADAELTYQDDRLNRAYKALLADLDDLDKRAAIQAQRVWLTFRGKDCGARAGRFGSNAGPATESACLMESTAYRAQQLEDWLGTLARVE